MFARPTSTTTHTTPSNGGLKVRTAIRAGLRGATSAGPQPISSVLGGVTNASGIG